ncbi:MAG: bifunctional demethylmenaquinone methyltransferase/2-methoxy-6-polyprenyl-1,4-benzoquinol methylase UbiE [Alphaproteobacteria bacterium]|nr:bifunctional demethylmenaquinone methyltransferase/2-methoxy-6-polyprenyl-1,4-benzoquinol methylase UbiE [Alphaproteobacteria bacterium]
MTDHNTENAEATTHFGYREVAQGERARLVRGVFDTVAQRYDLMNDLMSWGVHRLWKAALIDCLKPRPGMQLLDVAGGTGDIALRHLDAGGDDVTVCDVNAEMLSVGRDRALDRGVVDGIRWAVGDAEALPFPDRTMDAYTIAFGLRNVTDIDRALREARRVLKPGGRFLCLEFSRVVLPLLSDFYDRYSFSVVPVLGDKVAGDAESYRYLVESIRRFPDQDALRTRLGAAGLDRVTVQNLSGGIAAIHAAWRI